MNPVTHSDYDPWAKINLAKAIEEFLYRPAYTQFDKRVQDLLTRNTLLAGNGQTWFLYKGNHYRRDYRERKPKRVNRLDSRFWGEMDEYLEDLREMQEDEIPQVRTFLSVLMTWSDSVEDYKAVLPESVHAPIRERYPNGNGYVPVLTTTQVEALQRDNAETLALMKQRMVKNLLI